MRTEATGNAFPMRRLGERDVDAILALCEGNRLFYQYHPPMATRESILADMTALPPGKGMEDKAYVGFFANSELSAAISSLRFRAVFGRHVKETPCVDDVGAPCDTLVNQRGSLELTYH